MQYLTLPKRNGYHFEVNMDDSYQYLNNVDEWEAAEVIGNHGNGAEYNYYYDGKNELSAIYKVDGFDTDGSTYEMYEIDFGLNDWKERLINKMIECAEAWFGQ